MFSLRCGQDDKFANNVNIVSTAILLPLFFCLVFLFGIPFCSGSLLAQMVCVIEKHPPYHGKKGVVIYAWGFTPQVM